MCLSKPKVPTIQPVTQQSAAAKTAAAIPPPPPPPEPAPEAPVLNDERRKQQDVRKARKSGTRALRIDLSIPGSASGLNIPN